MTEEETELTSKQKLVRYEYGGLAGRIFKDQSRSAYSLEAMHGLYAGFGLDEDDPVLARSFAEAYAGVRDGQVTNSGIFKAIELYSKKYEIAYGESKVEDFMEYVEGKGFSDIPDEVRAIIDKYKGRTIEELEEKKKLAELRNASVVKQEKLIETKAHELQEELKNLLQKSPSTAK